MKKILSFVLVLAMIASMMCISVSAEEIAAPADSKVNIVGNPANNGGVPGATNWPGQDYTVNAIIGASVKNRYAVDITYKTSDVTLSGTATWNVTKLKYEGTIEVKALTTSTAVDAKVTVGEFTVKNYSDLEVKVTVIGTATLTSYDGITASVSDGEEVMAGAYIAGKESEKENKESEFEFDAYVQAADWAHVVAQLSQNNTTVKNTPFDLATFTITVSPVGTSGTDYSAD